MNKFRLIFTPVSPNDSAVHRRDGLTQRSRTVDLSARHALCESAASSAKRRLPWLCALLGMGLGVSAVVGLFESVAAELPVLVCFQSLVLDMAGNVGTQSLAVALRVLTDEPLTRRDKAALVRRETRVGFFNGCALGALSFVGVGAYLCVAGSAPAFAVSFCLAAAMVLAMTASALFGTLIPLLFCRLGVDPAVASGPLITTVNDLVAVVAYYGLCALLLLRAA